VNDEGVVAAKLKNRVDKKEFGRLAAIMKDNGGEYVPFNYGTKSGAYFKIGDKVAKPKEPAQKKLDLNETLFQVRVHMKDIDKLLKEAGY